MTEILRFICLILFTINVGTVFSQKILNAGNYPLLQVDTNSEHSMIKNLEMNLQASAGIANALQIHLKKEICLLEINAFDFSFLFKRRKYVVGLGAENLFIQQWNDDQVVSESELVRDTVPLNEFEFTPETNVAFRLSLNFAF